MSEAQTVVPLVSATRYPGVGPRAIATVIDAIVGFVVIGVPLLLLFGKQTTSTTNGGTTTTHSTSDPKVLALWLVLAVTYYAAFEGTFGATPGKFLLGLRVRGASGEKCSPREAVIRNVVRVVDFFPYFVPYLVAAIAVWTDNSSRHDLAPMGGHPADELVIEPPGRSLPTARSDLRRPARCSCVRATRSPRPMMEAEGRLQRFLLLLAKVVYTWCR